MGLEFNPVMSVCQFTKKGTIHTNQYNHSPYSGKCFISSYSQTILSRYQLFPKYARAIPNIAGHTDSITIAQIDIITPTEEIVFSILGTFL